MLQYSLYNEWNVMPTESMEVVQSAGFTVFNSYQTEYTLSQL